MKRIFICGAALSLVLWACDDDSSSGLDAGGDESSSATELSSGAEDPTSSVDAESSDLQPTSSDTKNPDSSADVESSSTELSSSSAISGSVTVPASDVSLTCASNQNNDAGDRAGDGAIPPVAFMYNLGNKAEIVIQNVRMNCGMQIENIDVSVGGDTLYVKPVIDETAPLANCICSTELDFYIDADEAFSDVTLLVFNYGGVNNPSNRMRIIKETRVTPAN